MYSLVPPRRATLPIARAALGARQRAVAAARVRNHEIDEAVRRAMQPRLPSAIARRCLHVDLTALPPGTDYVPGEGFVIEAVDAGTVTVRSESAAESDPDVTVTLPAGGTWTVGTLPQYAGIVRNPAGAEGALTRFEAVFR